MEKPFFRNCPNCNDIIGYMRVSDRNIADKKNTICDSCRFKKFNERNQMILVLLNNTQLTQIEISEQLKVNKHVVAKVVKKFGIKRKSILSEKTKKIRSDNFRKNILDKNLNKFGGSTEETYKKIFKTRFGYEYSIFKEKQPEFRKYYNQVRNITIKNLKKFNHLFCNLDNLGKCGENGKYQIDHIFSIKKGFDNKITPHLIGHPSNLRVISWEQNLRKSADCDITIEELINKSAEFLTKNHKIYLTDLYDFRD